MHHHVMYRSNTHRPLIKPATLLAPFQIYLVNWIFSALNKSAWASLSAENIIQVSNAISMWRYLWLYWHTILNSIDPNECPTSSCSRSSLLSKFSGVGERISLLCARWLIQMVRASFPRYTAEIVHPWMNATGKTLVNVLSTIAAAHKRLRMNHEESMYC